MKKSKVLMFTDTHSLKGGAEKYFFYLKKELQNKNVQVYSLGFGPKKEKGKNYQVIKETGFLFIRHFWRMFFNPLKYFQLRKYIKKINPDVIHLHNINKYTISLLRAVKGYNVVQTVHDYGLVCPALWNVHDDLKPCPTGLKFGCIRKHRRNYNWLVYISMLWFFWKRNRLLRKKVKMFIAPAPILADYLKKQGFHDVVFLPYIIDVKRKKIKKSNTRHILFIGQLEENKGVSFLVKAMKNVVQKVPGTKLLIAGTGSQEQALKNQVNKLHLNDNVEFLGWVSDADKIYQRCCFVVVPSIWMENAPVSIFEAMSHAKPVIGSNRGGIPWLVKDSETGFIVDVVKGGLSRKIISLLKNEKLRERFGRNAYKHLNEIMDKNKILKQLIGIYIKNKK